jgi:hypothetical protein
MTATGITEEQLYEAARQAKVELDITPLSSSGLRHRVKVNPHSEWFAHNTEYPRDSPWQRISAQTGRKVHAVCWHGFRNFFRECFKLAPNAVFRTALATWRGSADFEARYRASGHRNVGSQMYPICAAENCRCGEEGMAV